MFYFFFFKQKTAYEMRISDWSSDVCSSDLGFPIVLAQLHADERLQPQADALGLEFGPVAGDHAVELQPLYPSQTGRWRQVDPSGEVGRKEERRVGKECVSTCRSRGAPEHSKPQSTILHCTIKSTFVN